MHAHFIEFNGKYLVYLPLKRLAFIGNRALVDYLQARAANPSAIPPQSDIELFLERAGYWEPDPPPGAQAKPQPIRPAMAVLLMTNRCNLACTYCYAAAGSGAPKDMPWPIARTVIDAVVENARLNGDTSFGLSFHGGGEPTLNWPVFTAAVEHARARTLPCNISLATNGVWTPRIRDFVCRNINSVTLSFDGVKAVQNSQRPRRSRRGSFESALRAIHALDAAGVSYGIRMTATSPAFEHLADGVRFLCQETGVRAIQVEASFTIARGVYADPSPVEANRFIAGFLAAAQVAAEHRVFLTYSGARPWVIAHDFCLAPTQALIATPSGRLVACFEAAGDDHPYAVDFAIGSVTANGIEPDPVARNAFQQRQESRRSACRECFCYWHCCGDCASRAMVSKAPTSMRCHINREITKAAIAGCIARDGGVWTGREFTAETAGATSA